MLTDNLYLQLEKITSDFNQYDAETIREELQSFFDKVNLSYSTNHAPEVCNELTKDGHAVLKRLYNSNCICCDEYSVCDITSYFDNLCFCFDLLSGDWNKRVFFHYEKSESDFICNPKRLGWAFLNILSNAVVFSDGRYISITQKSTDDRILFIIENEGHFPYENYMSFPDKINGGLNCANSIVSAHGGSMYMTSFDNKTSVIFSLPRKEAENLPVFQVPEVDELLYDRLSVIYTALCEI